MGLGAALLQGTNRRLRFQQLDGDLGHACTGTHAAQLEPAS